MGAKVFGVARARQVTYLLPLFDQETSELVALVDALHITALRTAATSAVAVDRLAPRRPATLGVLGSGAEAQAHVRALAAVRTLRGVRLFSPNPANRERAALDLERELRVPCAAAARPADAVAGADIVVAAARSRDETPILDGEWLAPGALLVSIGSTVPEQRELDVRSIEVCDLIVCDAVHEVVNETGDFLAAKAAGVAFADKLASAQRPRRPQARRAGGRRPAADVQVGGRRGPGRRDRGDRLPRGGRARARGGDRRPARDQAPCRPEGRRWHDTSGTRRATGRASTCAAWRTS